MRMKDRQKKLPRQIELIVHDKLTDEMRKMCKVWTDVTAITVYAFQNPRTREYAVMWIEDGTPNATTILKKGARATLYDLLGIGDPE
jgi:hypothetical protein